MDVSKTMEALSAVPGQVGVGIVRTSVTTGDVEVLQATGELVGEAGARILRKCAYMELDACGVSPNDPIKRIIVACDDGHYSLTQVDGAICVVKRNTPLSSTAKQLDDPR